MANHSKFDGHKGPGAHSYHHKSSPEGGKVHKVMREYKEHTLHSGSKTGPKVTSRKQAIAIAFNEQRKAGK